MEYSAQMKTAKSLQYSKSLKWEALSEEELINTPIQDLGLSLKDSWLQKEIDFVLAEARKKGLQHKPLIWLSNEWFCPDGIFGFAIPFYLAHPKLIALEKKNMGSAEGANIEDCRKLLRHELGHAIENAYGLRRKKLRQVTFGTSGKNYPSTYTYKKYSRKFVKHLPEGYAQAHPDEDFAETFAVWLDPKSKWQLKYKNWPALNKLKAVDQLMTEAFSRSANQLLKFKVDPVEKLSISLATHYNKRIRKYGPHRLKFWDQKLNFLFDVEKPTIQSDQKSYRFLKSHQIHLTEKISQANTVPKYVAHSIVSKLANRTKLLKMQLRYSEKMTHSLLIATLIKDTPKFLKSEQYRIPV
jgi:Putative zinc-binding metallo-peptidase